MAHIRKKHTSKTKFEAAIAMIKGDKTLLEIGQKYQVHQSVLHRWKKELFEKGPNVYDQKSAETSPHKNAIEALQRKVGELTMDNDFLKKALGD